MDTVRSFTPRTADIVRAWHVIDASGRPLGRLATEVAGLLRGKHKPTFATHMDVGDYVVVLNASNVGITGKNKRQDKMYYRHTGYLGGLKAVSLADMLAQHPERVIEHAVRGMLPKGSLGRAMYRKLRVYPDGRHPHQGQVHVTEVQENDD